MHTCAHIIGEQLVREEGNSPLFFHYLCLLSWGRMPEMNRIKREERSSEENVFLFISLSYERWNSWVKRNNVHKAFFNDNFISPSLFRSLSRLELTLGLPRLPLSNGYMFQGKYPIERRTLVIKISAQRKKLDSSEERVVGRKDTWKIATVCSQDCRISVTLTGWLSTWNHGWNTEKV